MRVESFYMKGGGGEGGCFPALSFLISPLGNCNLYGLRLLALHPFPYHQASPAFPATMTRNRNQNRRRQNFFLSALHFIRCIRQIHGRQENGRKICTLEVVFVHMILGSGSLQPSTLHQLPQDTQSHILLNKDRNRTFSPLWSVVFDWHWYFRRRWTHTVRKG